MFLEQEHEQYYNKFIESDNTNPNDNERKALFYLLAFNNETRNHINDLYDFKNHQIEFKGLEMGWQTSGSFAVTKLAFNLYNGFKGVNYDVDDGEPREYSIDPLNLFCHFRGDNLNIMLNAIKIRLGEM